MRRQHIREPGQKVFPLLVKHSLLVLVLLSAFLMRRKCEKVDEVLPDHKEFL